MSQVDTNFSHQERRQLLSEVRSYLPAFLGASSTEHVDPVGDVTALLGLASNDLQRIISTHIALSNPVRQFVQKLPNALRRPISASTRPRVFSREIRGPIDWAATIGVRATKGLNAEGFVTRPAQRMFDTPENRALAYVIQQLQMNVSRTGIGSSGADNGSWPDEIALSVQRLDQARRTYWLRDIPAKKPDAKAQQRLAAARSRFYAQELPEVLDLLHRYLDEPTPQDITEILIQRYFEPSLDWQLFEIVVALRLAEAFASVSIGKRKSRLLVRGTGNGPYAHYIVRDDLEVRLWYQSWPNSSGGSKHQDACRMYSIAGNQQRPDIVIERVTPSGSTAILLELKASRSPSYLSQGIFQLLGYLADRPNLFSEQPSGWLVAPNSTAFNSVPPGDSTVWVVPAESVASEAVGACTAKTTVAFGSQ